MHDAGPEAENAYWDVVGAREPEGAEAGPDARRRQSLKRAQRELELGAISPAGHLPARSRSTPAREDPGLAGPQFRLVQSEDVLRRQIGADLDPDVRKLPIVADRDQSRRPPMRSHSTEKRWSQRRCGAGRTCRPRSQILDVGRSQHPVGRQRAEAAC